ncbi:response regulator transcription factor [Desulfobulbus sp. TB]|nr:response regulator transcription factor [Desulfobulbus sp. TB]
MYRIILADDHYLIRNGIKTMIAQEAGLHVISEAADGQELLDRLKENQPDMVILDISMPQVNGIEALKQIHALYPEIRMLVLTMHSNIQYCYHALSAGAHGYLLKDDSATELLPAILQVRDGKVYVSPQLAPEFSWRNDKKIQLTPREKEVLEMVARGLTTKKIAAKLCLSPRTVEHHRSNILKKFKKKNSVDLINYVVKNPYILYW